MEEVPCSVTDDFCVPNARAVRSSAHECLNDSSRAGSNRDTNASPLPNNSPLSRPPFGSWSSGIRASLAECQKGPLQMSRGTDVQHVEALMSRFKEHFTTVHIGHKYVDGEFVCVDCYSAMETLVEIRKAAIKEQDDSSRLLRDEEFMKLLVKLSMFDSPGLPRICSVTCSETRTLYETGAYRNLKATVNVHEDGAGEELWKGILGKAAESIRLPTYTVNFHGPRLRDGRSSMGLRTVGRGALVDVPRSNTPRTKQKVNPLPKSDLRKWSVVRCLDDRHLLVCCCAAGREGVNSLNNILAKCHRDSRPRKHRPEVGEIMGLPTSSECMLRVLVVDFVSDAAVVWTLDEGDFLKLPCRRLVDLLPSFKCLPPSIGLAVLPDVNAAPFLGLLRECIGFFQAVVNFHDKGAFLQTKIRMLTSLGVVEVLSNLLECFDCATRTASAGCLTQLCELQDGGRAVLEAGCLRKVRGRLRKLVEQHRHDPRTEERTLVNLLKAVFFRNDELRYQYADLDDVLLLKEIQERPSPDENLSQTVQDCLETLLDPHDESRRPVSPKLVAMRPEQLKNLDYSVHTPHKAMEHCYGLGAGPAHADPQSSVPPPPGSILTPSGHRCYLLNTLVPFHSDETHELQPLLDLELASVHSLIKFICSFLNTWQLCTIYCGITSDGLVRGLQLSGKGCDTVRSSIDSAMRVLEPCLLPQNLDVKFVPVLRTTQDVYEAASFFVVEISVHGVPRTVYSIKNICFLRERGQSYKATSQDVRAWIAKLEETRCKQASEEPLPTNT
ncbi:hypothetical protein V5799_012605 [Amblyomma americanum]|uniref:Schlafen AlbA-2 domain-containing protein n=1 Tax=Amblyomma americanum TaxID=6943 RepID=A0AAQ4EDY4_AMBAM